jgi:hypothetical protein
MGDRDTAARGSRRGKLATLQQLSDWSGVPYTSVRRAALDGYLPFVRLGSSKRMWVPWDAAERLMTPKPE